MWLSLAGAYDPALVQIRFDQSMDNKQGRITNHAHRPPAITVPMRVWFADMHGIVEHQFGQFKPNAVFRIVVGRFGLIPIPCYL
jgi:hypothetical protein